MKCEADGKRRQWTAVCRGATDQGSTAVERQRRGSGYDNDGWLCAGSQDNGGTVVAQAAAQTQGTEGALGSGGAQGTGAQGWLRGRCEREWDENEGEGPLFIKLFGN